MWLKGEPFKIVYNGMDVPFCPGYTLPWVALWVLFWHGFLVNEHQWTISDGIFKIDYLKESFFGVAV